MGVVGGIRHSRTGVRTLDTLQLRLVRVARARGWAVLVDVARAGVCGTSPAPERIETESAAVVLGRLLAKSTKLPAPSPTDVVVDRCALSLPFVVFTGCGNSTLRMQSTANARPPLDGARAHASLVRLS